MSHFRTHPGYTRTSAPATAVMTGVRSFGFECIIYSVSQIRGQRSLRE